MTDPRILTPEEVTHAERQLDTLTCDGGGCGRGCVCPDDCYCRTNLYCGFSRRDGSYPAIGPVNTIAIARRAILSVKALRAKLTEAERERDELWDVQRSDYATLLDAWRAQNEPVPGKDGQSVVQRVLLGICELRRERDEARAKLATVEAERDRFQEWARGNRDEAEKAWARCHNAEAALAQMREENERLAEEVSDARSYARDMDAVAKIDSQRAEQAESRCAALEQALVKVRAHTSYSFDESHGKDARIALLNGLLASIERIVDAALAADAPATPPAKGDI